MFKELERRLQHWTFVVGFHGILSSITRPVNVPSTEQPAAMRKALQALREVRWRCELGCGDVKVALQYWVLSHALISELGALPTFGGHAVTLSLHETQWVTGCQYESLPSTLPACYSTWVLYGVSGLTIEHLLAICRGARARDQQFGKLVVLVKHDRRFTDEQRSHIEACIDQDGLGRWVSVEWESL